MRHLVHLVNVRPEIVDIVLVHEAAFVWHAGILKTDEPRDRRTLFAVDVHFP